MVCHRLQLAARRGAGCALPAPRAPHEGVSEVRVPARTPGAAAGGLPLPSERVPATCGERARRSGVAGVHRVVQLACSQDEPGRWSATAESSTRSPARGAPMSASPCSPSPTRLGGTVGLKVSVESSAGRCRSDGARVMSDERAKGGKSAFSSSSESLSAHQSNANPTHFLTTPC